MAAALIRIDQPTHPTMPIGIVGRSRDDIVLGEPVQLRNADDTGVRSWRWEILDQPDLASPDALSNPTVAAPTFTPNAAGTYLIRLIVNEGKRGEVHRRIVAVRDANGLRPPAAGERDEANWLDVTGNPNSRGWQPEMVELFERAVGDLVARSVLGRAGATAGPPAAIQSGGDDRFLVQRAGELTFDTIQVGDVPGGGSVSEVEHVIDLRAEAPGAIPGTGTLDGGMAYTCVTPANTTWTFVADGARYNHATTPGSPPDGGSTNFGTTMAQLNGCGHIRFQLSDAYSLLGIDESWEIYFRAYWQNITWHSAVNRVAMHLRGDADAATASSTNRVRGVDLVGDGTVDARNSSSTLEYSAAPASTVNVMGLMCRPGAIPLATLGRWSEGDGTVEGVPVDFAIDYPTLPVSQLLHRNAWIAFVIMSGTTSQNLLSATLQQIRISARRVTP